MFGYWEGDLILGSRNSYVVILVECYFWFVMLVYVDGKDSNSVVSVLI